MARPDDLTLRDYLRLQSRQTRNEVCIEEYDSFLVQVWDFFALRASAERYFDEHRHVAYSRSGALPVTWETLRRTWRTGGPPEQPITVIANRHASDIAEILGHMRKVLRRETQKVPLGRVQQVDAHCLRWLVRQPGRTAIEKGGARQEILGVVRTVSCDTLENRVLKDFLRRCVSLATLYLRRYARDYPDHAHVKSVSRFRNVCRGGLARDEFASVRELRDFPQPNFVLLQDRLYSKIWTSYCEILQQEDVAERLWARRREVNDLYSRCEGGMDVQCNRRARYCTPLWINRMDGNREILECPIWENEIAESEVCDPPPPGTRMRTIDFTNPWGGRRELVYPSNHRNARPFLQNPNRPSLEPGDVIPTETICEQDDSQRWSDYLRALHGVIGGERWIMLSPDHWDARKLEVVARALPPRMPRPNVFFLWRSVAAALGLMESGCPFRVGDSLVVRDGYSSSRFNEIEIRFREDEDSGEVVPQRAAARLHDMDDPKCADPRFCLRRSHDDSRKSMAVRGVDWKWACVGNALPLPREFPDDSLKTASCIFEDGVVRYERLSECGQVSYFDEREALSLIVQTRSEEVFFKSLVEHEECSPGGKVYRGDSVDGGFLPSRAKKLAIYLLEGEARDDAKLKSLETNLDEPPSQDSEIFLTATLTPGQGLAHIDVSSAVLTPPLQLDLTEMQESDATKAKIERELKRHFPPVMPLVEACDEMWPAVSASVRDFMRDRFIPPNDLFAKAQPYWGAVDPTGKSSYRRFGTERHFDENAHSPIDKLKRENVFGNAPTHRYPVASVKSADWRRLFERLAEGYRAMPKRFLRLIAWSYQFDEPCFEFMREAFHSRYVKEKGCLGPMEVTFCSNNFDKADGRVSSLMQEVLTRIGNGKYLLDELRLAYNLMQFYPSSLSNVDSAVCDRAMFHLMSDFRSEYTSSWVKGGRWQGRDATKAVGYYLKCMLFLLHRRRTDASFFRQPEDWSPQGVLNWELPDSTQTLRLHESTRKAFIQYVRGHGTIEGIPMGDA